ncbi:MAG: DUF4426 domain-containing protein [Steroidobacteraceae bacterium]
MRSVPAPAILGLLALLAACGAEPPAPVAARVYADPGVVVGSGYEMRYGIVPMADIPAPVRRAYGLTGNADGLLVNVSVLQRNAAGQAGTSVESRVSGSVRRLTGQDSPLEFQVIRTGETVSYIAQAPLHDREPVTFLLEATPLQSSSGISARVVRQFDRARQ